MSTVSIPSSICAKPDPPAGPLLPRLESVCSAQIQQEIPARTDLQMATRGQRPVQTPQVSSEQEKDRATSRRAVLPTPRMVARADVAGGWRRPGPPSGWMVTGLPRPHGMARADQGGVSQSSTVAPHTAGRHRRIARRQHRPGAGT